MLLVHLLLPMHEERLFVGQTNTATVSAYAIIASAILLCNGSLA